MLSTMHFQFELKYTRLPFSDTVLYIIELLRKFGKLKSEFSMLKFQNEKNSNIATLWNLQVKHKHILKIRSNL